MWPVGLHLPRLGKALTRSSASSNLARSTLALHTKARPLFAASQWPQNDRWVMLQGFSIGLKGLVGHVFNGPPISRKIRFSS